MITNILLIRSVPLERDARSTKMVAEYRRHGMRVISLVWSRGGSPSTAPDTITCTAKGGYGNGLRGIGARLAFMWFVATYMLLNRASYRAVHVVDLDTGIIGVPIARLLGKPIIYDAFDHIGAIAGKSRLTGLLVQMERWAIRQAEIAIFPDPIRLRQYGIEPNEAVRIIGNIPDLNSLPTGNETKRGAWPLRLVYLGTLEAMHRGLEYLPEICISFGDKIEIVVGGIGELHDFFEKASSSVPNLIYIGQQDYDAALQIMAEADCLYGPYLLTTSAHRYASPNKMYEHLALGRPLITNTGTPPAEIVDSAGSGFLFDGSIDDLQRKLSDLDREKCEVVGRQAAMAWARDYAGLRERQLESFFLRMSQVIGSVP